ncbi:MAG: hypothetical protein ABWY05_15400 [Noviherbaspirillum sp.]
MNTTVNSYSGNFSTSAPARKLVQRQSRLSVGSWIAAMSNALSMASAIPDNGRISAKELAKVRAIAESI